MWESSTYNIKKNSQSWPACHSLQISIIILKDVLRFIANWYSICGVECSNSVQNTYEYLDPNLQITNTSLLSNNICAEYENKLK